MAFEKAESSFRPPRPCPLANPIVDNALCRKDEPLQVAALRLSAEVSLLSHFLQIVLAGISIGAIYSLAALGFTIVFNATKVTNFANGEFVMMGGLVAATLVSNADWPTLPAVAVAVIVVSALGVALDKFGVQQARRKTILGYAMVTIGFSLLYRGIMQVGVGRDVLFMPNFGVLPELRVKDIYFTSQSTWILLTLVIDRVLRHPDGERGRRHTSQQHARHGDEHDAAGADRCGRRHPGMEQPDPRPVVRHRRSAGDRVQRGPQAGGVRFAVSALPGEPAQGSRRSRWRGQCRDRLRADGRCRAGRAHRCESRRVHRLRAHRSPRRRSVGQQHEARAGCCTRPSRRRVRPNRDRRLQTRCRATCRRVPTAARSAPRARACSCSARSTRSLSSAWSPSQRRCASAMASTPRSNWVRSSRRSNSIGCWAMCAARCRRAQRWPPAENASPAILPVASSCSRPSSRT
jgi:hypothetical protein